MERARASWREALLIWETTGRSGYPGWGFLDALAVETYVSLANQVRDVGELEDARRLYEVVLLFAAQSRNPQPSAARVREEYAMLLRRLGRNAEAAEQEAQADALRTEAVEGGS